MVTVNALKELVAPKVPAKAPLPLWPVAELDIELPATPLNPAPKLYWVVAPKSVKAVLPAGETVGVTETVEVPPFTPFVPLTA